MLKIIIVLILIGYVFHKVASFFFRGMFQGFSNRDQFAGQQPYQRSKKARGSDLNIDNVPNKKSRKGSTFTGGEYVDYEEVK